MTDFELDEHVRFSGGIMKISGTGRPGIILLCCIAGIIFTACTPMNVKMSRVLYYDYKNDRNMARKLSREGKCNESIETMKQAVATARKIKELVPDDKHAAEPLSEAYKLLGSIYSDDSCKMYPEALEAYRKSLYLREKIFGKRHPLYAYVLSDMAWGYYAKKKMYKKAVSLTMQALKIYETTSGDRKGRYHAYTNLGLIYHWQRKYRESDSMFEKLIDLVDELYIEGKISATGVTKRLTIYHELLEERNDRVKALRVSNIIEQYRRHEIGK